MRIQIAVEVAGMLAIVAGLWWVFPPLALVVAGLGAVLWAQGAKASPKEPDR